jgi:hypothetical protein
MVAQPFGAAVYLRNMKLIPELPLADDDVYIEAELYDTFLNPSNILLKAIFQTGTGNWGLFDNRKERIMAIVKQENGITTYRTTTPFQAGGHPIDTVVQYYVQATFDGFFSEISSPVKYKEFTNPDWYWPVDLNSNKTYQTPYYVVFSCYPGQVWINELNIADDDYAVDVVTQYIEVVGSSQVDIGKWKVQIINPDFTTNATYSIPQFTTLDGTNYGFFMFGDTNMPGAGVTLTNPLPDSAGVKLFRSMGAQECAVSWDVGLQGDGYDMAQDLTQRFVYAGYDDDWEAYPISLYGNGSNSTDFAWANDKAFTAGFVNDSQTLIPWSNETNTPYSGTVEIGTFSFDSTKITFDVITAGSNSITFTPWYTTNLLDGTWLPGVNPGQSQINETTYRVWCDLVTDAPGAFYKVMAK